MIEEHNFTDKQRELYELMSGISEDCYAASWMRDNEHAIWKAIHGWDRSYGISMMDAKSLERCRVLSEELGGWIIWVDNSDGGTLLCDDWGPRFISMDEWNIRLSAREARERDESRARKQASAMEEDSIREGMRALGMSDLKEVAGTISTAVDDCNKSGFKSDLSDLINRYSKENGSDTPDFILADYLADCLEAFDKAVGRRSGWYKPEPKDPPKVISEKYT